MSDQFARDVTRDGVRGHGENFFLGLVAGLVAMVIGAGVWMGVAVTAGSQLHLIPIGFMAIGVGALVGFSVRVVGNGRGIIFGILGAVLTFLGCLGGDVLTVVQQSTGPTLSFVDALRTLDLTLLVTNLFSRMDVITYVAYGIGIYEGFVLSRRK
jgi:hypothetical protein